MSTVPSDIPGAPLPTEPERSEPITLPPRAKAFLYGIGALAAAAAALPFAHLSLGTDGWTTFLVLSTCAAIAQLFVVRTPRDQSYHTTIVFLIPGVLLLPPELIALLGVVYGIPEWLKVRYAWYIQAFNIANHTLNGLAAWGAVELVRSAGLGPNLEFALSGLVASVVFVSLNHAVLATMLHFARGHSFRGTGLFSVESLSTDFVLALLGVAVRRALGLEPAPPADGRRAPHPRAPLAERAGAAAGGSARREDGALQRPPLRKRAQGGARARAPLRDAARGDHGRPRPAPRHQQRVRAPRRRRRPARDRHRLPAAPATLGHPGAVRRGGVRDHPPGDDATGGFRDRRADSPGGRRGTVRGRDVERADQSHGVLRHRSVSR